jgi:1,4-alpha-glucan branching enzyme
MERTKASRRVKEKRAGNKVQPMNIYEVHVGSWKDGCDSYLELAKELPDYLLKHGYSHVELMPVMHHPFGGSWGYQVTNFFAPNADWGTPGDLRKLIDAFHEAGISVIMDWVPGHFCKNDEGPSEINGGYVYESAEHPEWGTKRFQLKRTEVISFLLSNAAFWFDYYDIDGIRVDGVASMLQPEENFEEDAIEFLQLLNESIFGRFPYAIMAAEDSTAFPNVTKPVFAGGLGFNYKWNMGWMNDTLSYFSRSPQEKRDHHHELTFSSVYAYSESFILPFSHDEVVHGKKTLLDRMPGNYDEMFALLRVLYMYMMTHPGKKLNFMGNEFAPFLEWRYDEGLEWKMLKYDLHRYFYHYMDALNHFYLKDKTLWEVDHKWEGFEWIDADNAEQSVYIYKRNASDPDNFSIIILNIGQYEHKDFRVGVPTSQKYRLAFSTCSGQEKLKKTMQAAQVPFHRQEYSIRVHLPAYTGMIIKPIKKRKKRMKKND